MATTVQVSWIRFLVASHVSRGATHSHQAHSGLRVWCGCCTSPKAPSNSHGQCQPIRYATSEIVMTPPTSRPAVSACPGAIHALLLTGLPRNANVANGYNWQVEQ